MSMQPSDTTGLVSDLCGDVLEHVGGLGAYALPAATPMGQQLRPSVAVQPRDLAVCIQVLCPRPLRDLVLEKLGRLYNVLGRATGSDGTSYLACALPLTARSVPQGPQTFTIAVP